MKNYKTYSYKKMLSAFSLAEAMIMLVVIAIILGISAPLISKNFTATTNRAATMDNNGNIHSAQASNQIFIVGKENNNVIPFKMQVNGNAYIVNSKSKLHLGTNSTLNKDNEERNIIKTIKFNNASGVPALFLKFNESNKNKFINNKTNIASFESVLIGQSLRCTGENTYVCQNIDKDGFLYVENALKGFLISDEIPAGYSKLYANTTTTNDETEIKAAAIKIDDSGAIETLPIIIPIKKGQYFRCGSSCYVLFSSDTNIK